MPRNAMRMGGSVQTLTRDEKGEGRVRPRQPLYVVIDEKREERIFTTMLSSSYENPTAIACLLA